MKSPIIHHSETIKRMCIKFSTIALAVSMAASAVKAEEERRYYDIQAEGVGEALQAFAAQTNTEILFASAIVKGKRSKSITGQYTQDEALKEILMGTGLKVSKTEDNIYLVQTSAGQSTSAAESEGDRITESKTIKKLQSDSKPKRLMEEVFVTANKRVQNINEAALSITALSAEDIQQKNLVSLSDYLSAVPGVTIADQGVGRNRVVIRGIGINATEQSTVTTYLDEVPLTNTLRFSTSTDMKLVDIERVEVLRGPQGTLYGSGAMGGAVRYISNKPNVSESEGKLTLGYGASARSNDNSNKAVGVFNVPLVQDRLALRVVGYHFENAGFTKLVRDPQIESLASNTGTTIALRDDVGGQTYTGGRASLLWEATEELNISLMLATQKLEEDGRKDIKVSNGNYTHVGLSEGREFKDDEFDVASLSVEYDFGWATLFSTTSSSEGLTRDRADLGKGGGLAAAQTSKFEKEGFVQEIRLSSKLNGSLQFIGGLYYEDMDFKSSRPAEWYGSLESFNAIPSLGDNPLFFTQDITHNAEQLATFGEVSYALNDQWEITLGGRWSEYERSDKTLQSFAGVSNDPVNLDTEEDDTTFKINTSYTPNDETLIYLQWAQGFRIGSGQATPARGLCDVDNNGLLDFTNTPIDPGPIESDFTNNFEIGGKFTFFEDRLSINAAIYRINWEDIPIVIRETSSSQPGSTCPSGSSVTVNGGEARSEGIELDTRYSIFPNLQVGLSAAYMDAEFRDDTISTKGDRLPTSPRFNGNLSIKYDFDIAGYNSYLRTDYNFVGTFYNDIARSFPESGGYEKLNLKAGIEIDNFTVEVYGTNLTNADDLTFVVNDTFGYRLDPRTFGIDVGYQF